MLLASLAPAADLRWDVRHDHWRGSAPGVLSADAHGVRYQERGRHSRSWNWCDIQQLLIEPRRAVLLTYSDNRWKLGADREHTFLLSSPGTFEELARLAKSKIDARAVLALAAAPGQPQWEISVKRKEKFGGSEGVLSAFTDRLVYNSAEPGESRTWLLEDIENVSSSDPYECTLTTYERARLSYGSRRSFHFQLKQRLSERQYNDLWRRLNQTLLEKQSQ